LLTHARVLPALKHGIRCPPCLQCSYSTYLQSPLSCFLQVFT
jgi:hypothetical protein